MFQLRWTRQQLVYGICFALLTVASMVHSPGFAQSVSGRQLSDPATTPGTIPGPYRLLLPNVANFGDVTGGGTIPPLQDFRLLFPLIANSDSSASE